MRVRRWKSYALFVFQTAYEISTRIQYFIAPAMFCFVTISARKPVRTNDSFTRRDTHETKSNQHTCSLYAVLVYLLLFCPVTRARSLFITRTVYHHKRALGLFTKTDKRNVNKVFSFQNVISGRSPYVRMNFFVCAHTIISQRLRTRSVPFRKSFLSTSNDGHAYCVCVCVCYSTHTHRPVFGEVGIARGRQIYWKFDWNRLNQKNNLYICILQFVGKIFW